MARDRNIGGSALLFDRLTDTSPSDPVESQPLRVPGLDAFLDSVAREISTILNTRSHAIGALAEGTVLDFGIPDFGSLAAKNESDLDRLADTIRRKVLRHDPRVRDAEVSLEPDRTRPDALMGTLRIKVYVGSVGEPVWFEIGVAEASARIRVAGAGS